MGDDRLKEQDLKREAIINELLRLRPDVELKRSQYVTELIYYGASVVKGKIKIERNTRGIYIKDNPANLVRYGYRTEAEARQAIGAVLPLAQAHFDECLKQYRELTSRLGFSIGYNYDGDGHGIYNEYEYISFKMQDFHFSFEID